MSTEAKDMPELVGEKRAKSSDLTLAQLLSNYF
jgi:hypothetical protein